jgi:uncharacterized protein YigE (DUF2233 family)
MALCWSCAASAIELGAVSIAGKQITICRVNVKTDHLGLFLNDDEGQPLESFTGLNAWLQKSGRKLVFAMNAGMFERNLMPVGLFVSDGRQLTALNLANGKGNFFLKPNGVFLVTPAGARIISSEEYYRIRERVIIATQSGPILVQSGKINPVFDPKSASRLFRNGVGVLSPEEAVFAISDNPVNFYEFALLFRDVLHCRNALFFDGTVSSLFAPQLGRNDRRTNLGPMIGVVD